MIWASSAATTPVGSIDVEAVAGGHLGVRVAGGLHVAREAHLHPPPLLLVAAVLRRRQPALDGVVEQQVAEAGGVGGEHEVLGDGVGRAEVAARRGVEREDPRGVLLLELGHRSPASSAPAAALSGANVAKSSWSPPWRPLKGPPA